MWINIRSVHPIWSSFEMVWLHHEMNDMISKSEYKLHSTPCLSLRVHPSSPLECVCPCVCNACYRHIMTKHVLSTRQCVHVHARMCARHTAWITVSLVIQIVLILVHGCACIEYPCVYVHACVYVHMHPCVVAEVVHIWTELSLHCR